MFTVKEVAQQLNVATSTIYALCQAGDLAHTRIGKGRGTIRINAVSLADYLSRAAGVSCRTPYEGTANSRRSDAKSELASHAFKHVDVSRLLASRS